VVAYDCVHRLVQAAAGVLTAALINKGDFYDAERYSQITYENLRDSKNGMDHKSEQVANSACNLARAIYHQKGDFVKSERLARESLRIRTLLYGNDNHKVGTSCNFLATTLSAQQKLGVETRGLSVLWPSSLKMKVQMD
jgi:hypothetical protein